MADAPGSINEKISVMLDRLYEYNGYAVARYNTLHEKLTVLQDTLNNTVTRAQAAAAENGKTDLARYDTLINCVNEGRKFAARRFDDVMALTNTLHTDLVNSTTKQYGDIISTLERQFEGISNQSDAVYNHVQDLHVAVGHNHTAVMDGVVPKLIASIDNAWQTVVGHTNDKTGQTVEIMQRHFGSISQLLDKHFDSVNRRLAVLENVVGDKDETTWNSGGLVPDPTAKVPDRDIMDAYVVNLTQLNAKLMKENAQLRETVEKMRSIIQAPLPAPATTPTFPPGKIEPTEKLQAMGKPPFSIPSLHNLHGWKTYGWLTQYGTVSRDNREGGWPINQNEYHKLLHMASQDRMPWLSKHRHAVMKERERVLALSASVADDAEERNGER